MQYHIENDFLKVAVRNYGAELTSVFNKTTATEHLWQADTGFWGWHAPVLFPVVGRCLHDKIWINGEPFSMEKHGFARKSVFELVEKSAESLQFVLKSSENTKQHYPFDFAFYITYTLQHDQLHCDYRVVNPADQTLYFSLGGHPAFNAPLFEGEKYEDYFIRFDHDTELSRHYIDEDGFFTNEKKEVLSDSSDLPLHHAIFARDAYIFKNLKSRKISLLSNNHAHGTAVSFPDFDYLGLWAKENAPYVCIEPWRGCADTAGNPTEFSQKEGIIELPAQKTFEATITIHIF